MKQTSLSLEQRIASLQISEAERQQALAYVQAGEKFAGAIVAFLRLFSARSTPVLSHNH